MHKETNKKTIFASVLAVLLVSSAFFVFINPEVKTVQAQTTIPNDMLKYEWPSVAASSSRSFCSDGPGPETPSIKWKAAIPGSTGCNVAFNGFLFAQGTAGTYALNGATGETVWLFKGVGNIAKIDNTYMVIGSRCVKIATGELVWTGPAGFSNGQGAFAGTGYVPE